MANNKGSIDRLHDLLPRHLNSKTNTNWKAIVEAIGEQDQLTANLIEEIRKQFFVKTASRPYIDRLASNSKISRPKFVGMDDSSFREYIPVLSYKPKQVKLIIDKLLDIFFFKESTTAFISSQQAEPFALSNGWELSLNIDQNNTETVRFTSSEFANIAAAKADEIVASYNRQAKYSYATSEYDSITKTTFIKIFTNTVGSKGSIEIIGGRANIALRLNGFISTAGNGTNTQWTVTKIGDTATFQYTAGATPNIDQLNIGDIVIINLSGNEGSFRITDIDIANNSINFINLFTTTGVFNQTNSNQVKFIRPSKYVAYLNPKRAISWETSPSEIIVEMPTSPPVVRRSLKGSAHINGIFSNMTSRNTATSLSVEDAALFPNVGTFVLERNNNIISRILTDDENIIVNKEYRGRLVGSPQRYNYTGRTVLATTGDIIEGQSQITNLASMVGITIGQDIAMDGIPAYAKVTGIAGPIVNISIPATATVSSGAISFLGNTLTGITPNLPPLSDLAEFSLSSLSRASNTVTCNTSGTHTFEEGEYVTLVNNSGIVAYTKSCSQSIGDTFVTAIDVIGLAPGMLVYGSGIDPNTRITSISGLTVNISKPVTLTAVGNLDFNEDVNGTHLITAITPTTFTFTKLGVNGSSVIAGSSRVERAGLLGSGSKVIVTDAVRNTATRITGPYIWDKTMPFVLSSNKGETVQLIQAGRIIRLLDIGVNDLPNEGGTVVFDYGLATQEGPVRYLYKPTPTTLAIDPSYTFKKNHAIGASVTKVSRTGPHTVSSSGKEYAPYITDPSAARVILQDLIRSVKSSGIFVNFLVRFPTQLYATVDVYFSGEDPG